MSKEVSIFKQANAISTSVGKSGLTNLGQSLVGSRGRTTRRIQTSTNGTFKRLVNGEQVGKAARGSVNVIIVNALPAISRVYYQDSYDPSKQPTLPNCWSNLGDRPDEGAEDPQSASCSTCPQNVAGSGSKGGRACRYQRRIAVLLENDTSGDVYQFNIPAKSLFGKGSGNVHPFESYIRFLAANRESPDTVVTAISYNDDADSMELEFTPVRGLEDAEYELVAAAQADPETQSLCELTVAQASKVTKSPARPSEPDTEEADIFDQPKKRGASAKKAAPKEISGDLVEVLDEWADD